MPIYPDGALGVLFLPLVLALFERRKIQLVLYFIFCGLMASWDGVAAGVVYWVVYMLVQMGFDFFSARGDLSIEDSSL